MQAVTSLLHSHRRARHRQHPEHREREALGAAPTPERNHPSAVKPCAPRLLQRMRNLPADLIIWSWLYKRWLHSADDCSRGSGPQARAGSAHCGELWCWAPVTLISVRRRSAVPPYHKQAKKGAGWVSFPGQRSMIPEHTDAAPAPPVAPTRPRSWQSQELPRRSKWTWDKLHSRATKLLPTALLKTVAN